VLLLLVVLAVLAVALTAVMWFGVLFVQSYLYTSTPDGLFWRAPAAAVALTLFYGLWAMMNVWEGTTTRLGGVEIPYGVAWEFSPRVAVIREPVSQFVSKRRTSDEALYMIDKSSPRGTMYRRADGGEYWSAAGVEYVKFKHDGQEYFFKPDKTRDEDYVVFVDDDTGLEMTEYQIGTVGYTSSDRLIIYLVLNVCHLLLWVACLWLLLGFQFWHAAGLGLIVWMVATVAVLPGLFERAAAGV
jgi:hypothetical protein